MVPMRCTVMFYGAQALWQELLSLPDYVNGVWSQSVFADVWAAFLHHISAQDTEAFADVRRPFGNKRLQVRIPWKRYLRCHLALDVLWQSGPSLANLQRRLLTLPTDLLQATLTDSMLVVCPGPMSASLNCDNRAALEPVSYASDNVSPLLPSQPPTGTKAFWCQLCDFQCAEAAVFQTHKEFHIAAPADKIDALYRRAVLTAQSEAWPAAISPQILRHVAAKTVSRDNALIAAPEPACSVCALRTSVADMRGLHVAAKENNFERIHSLLSARNYHARHHSPDAAMPPHYQGLPWDTLRATAVPAPVHCFSPESSLLQILRETDDAWLLYLQAGPAEAAYHDCLAATSSVCLPCCLECHRSLTGKHPRMPRLALANGNWAGPVPPELADLTEAEQLFCARGFTVRKMKLLKASGAPDHRQKALVGGTIAFPQEGAQLLNILPRRVSDVVEMITVYFTGIDKVVLGRRNEFIIRRSKVSAALTWLQKHNPYYADVVIDSTLLEELPDGTVPDALLEAAVLTQNDIRRASGPADASTSGTLSESETPPFHAAVVDNEGESFDPVRLWQAALTAADTVLTHTISPAANPSAAAEAAEQAHKAIRALRTLNTPAAQGILQQDAEHSIPTANTTGNQLRALAPHGTQALDSYHPAFWSLCFPRLFPYSTFADGMQRMAWLRDDDWARATLLRADRKGFGAWCLHTDFIAVLFSVVHRRRLLRAIRARVRSPAWERSVAQFQNLSHTDFEAVYHAVGAKGGLQAALRSRDVSEAMKNMLRTLQLVQGTVPCTDGARTMMRNKMVSMHFWSGFPVAFFTLNPADTHHPFTLRFSNELGQSMSFDMPGMNYKPGYGHDGFVSVSAAEELCTSVAEEQEPTDAGDVQDELSDQDDPEQPGEPDQSMNGVLPRTRLIVAMQHLDYEHRGPVLAEWSWYFYIAGVCKVKLRNYSEGDQVFPFSDAHPEARFLAQRVLHSTPWRVPLLLGPAEAAAALPADQRPHTFSATYWARRTLTIIRNIDNWTVTPPFSDTAGVRTNPSAAMGHANSVELLPNGEMAQVPADATSDSSDDDDLPPDDFDVPASSTEDPAGSSHRAQALFTPDADYLRLNARSELKDGLPTMPNTDPYLETVMRMHDRYREPVYVAGQMRNTEWRLPTTLEAAGDFMQLPPVKAASLAADPVQPKDMDLTARTAWESDHEEAISGRKLWKNIDRCILLDYSHRCAGALCTLLYEMTKHGKLSQDSWAALQNRVLTHPSAQETRQAYRQAPFACQDCPVGVLRHSVRASFTYERAVGFARASQQRLLVAVASDRCTGQSANFHLQSAVYKDLASVHNLSTTAHLSNCLFLWRGVRLTLEEKMCVELGVVRGCAAVVLDILPDEREPLYDQGAHLEPFLFRYVPEALIMEVPGATWLKEPELGPGRFYLGRAKRNWKYNVSINMACHFLDAATTKKPVTINRVQLPVTNMFALTVYALQGQTLPAIIVDVARPPGMSRDEHWISLLVLLSRVRQIEDVVILRLPEKKCFEGGPPEFLTSEYARLMCLEQETLLMLDKQLAAVQLHDIRAQVTQPLLNEMRNTVETRKRQDIQSSSLPKRRRAT
ncbi:unnamed protein product [Polarella glacialis]|uniref:DUF6570 domain-containing protein n=1 Tax=Polarella glacialis TaxID=89957 RepID=A0A813EIR1_POLGL|nr:unnamed protein product [Polarella glacialis]